MKSVIYNKKETEEQKKKTNDLKEQFSSELKLLRQGSVTEITMGSQTFQVTDPKRIEALGNIVVKHDGMLFEIRHSLSTANQSIKILHQEIINLKAEVQTLKEQSNNGYGSQERSDY